MIWVTVLLLFCGAVALARPAPSCPVCQKAGFKSDVQCLTCARDDSGDAVTIPVRHAERETGKVQETRDFLCSRGHAWTEVRRWQRGWRDRRKPEPDAVVETLENERVRKYR